MLKMPQPEQPQTQDIGPGIIMTNEEYHEHPAISSSQLKLMDESYAHFKHRELFKFTTGTMDFGTLVHTMTLEPETFDQEFSVQPVGAKKSTTIGKQKWEDHEAKLDGRISVGEDEVKLAAAMAVNAKAIINELLGVEDFTQAGYAERSFFAIDPATQLEIKCRVDFLTKALIMLDLKSTKRIDDRDLKSTVTDFNYARQIAFYEKVLELNGIKPKRSALVFAESAGGNFVKIRMFDDVIIDEARRDIDEKLIGYAKYLSGESKASIAKNILPWPEREE